MINFGTDALLSRCSFGSVRLRAESRHILPGPPMSARAADDFVAIRTRMEELRQRTEVRAREAVNPDAVKEHYPQYLGAVTRLLHGLALREARALNFCNLESILHYATLTSTDKPRRPAGLT
jgi:hypothetical protein